MHRGDFNRAQPRPQAHGIATLRKQEPDSKEGLEIGSEPGDYPVEKEVSIWLEGLEGFEEKMTWFYERCDELQHVLLGAIAEGLGIQRDYFRMIKNGDHVLRLLHYPSVDKGSFDIEDAVRTGSHTDYRSDFVIDGWLRSVDRDSNYVPFPGGNWWAAHPVSRWKFSTM